MDNGKTILLVEDNINDELLAMRALKKNDLIDGVSIARDGAEAIDYITDTLKNTEQSLPELILLDLNLPRINGLEVLKQLKNNEATRHIPIIIMTSSNEDSDINTSYLLGANSYLRKPVDFNEFSSLIDELASYWLKLNRSPLKPH